MSSQKHKSTDNKITVHSEASKESKDSISRYLPCTYSHGNTPTIKSLQKLLSSYEQYRQHLSHVRQLVGRLRLKPPAKEPQSWMNVDHSERDLWTPASDDDDAVVSRRTLTEAVALPC
jgi:hypothetical protein